MKYFLKKFVQLFPSSLSFALNSLPSLTPISCLIERLMNLPWTIPKFTETGEMNYSKMDTSWSKNAISPERCEYYIDKMFQWLESFPLGFDRNNRSTWTEQHLPTHIKGGMYHGYRIQHEKFMWEART